MVLRRSGSLAVGLAGSTALHAGLALALFLTPQTATKDAGDRAPRVMLIPPPSASEEPKVVLGLDDPEATGQAWLGVLDPTPHASPHPGQTDQAELSPAPGAVESAEAGGLMPVDSGPVAHPVEAAAPREHTHSSSDAATPAMSSLSTDDPRPLTTDLPAVSVPADTPIPALAAAPSTPSDHGHVATPADRVNGRPGILDSRESDATAKTPIPNAIPGRPLAAHGLEITTVRPRWPISTRVTRDPANPTVRITFSRAGRVIGVEFLKSTGFDDVDEPLRTALYQWTARGAALASIPERTDPAMPEPGFTITVRVVLQ